MRELAVAPGRAGSVDRMRSNVALTEIQDNWQLQLASQILSFELYVLTGVRRTRGFYIRKSSVVDERRHLRYRYTATSQGGSVSEREKGLRLPP